MGQNIASSFVQRFSADAASGGYVYTRRGRLSSELSNSSMGLAISGALPLAGKRVVDLGCGDGTYTLEFVQRDRAAYVLGVDPAAEAIAHANSVAHASRVQDCEFSQTSIHDLDMPDAFDVAVLRGVLHHIDNPAAAVEAALRIARRVIILEPNGLNPVLKVIEKTSSYHRAHGERSFLPSMIGSWVRAAGGKVMDRRFITLVPFFCPDGLARVLKRVEPFVEGAPFVRNFVCGQCLVVGERMV
jgi:SAM-dependent methyltransferase